MAKRPGRTRSACPSCGRQDTLESITVRVYRKRWQTDFRFRLCNECRDVLFAFLEGPADSIQKGLFDHA